jgi:S-adenosylmethionine synthetase
LIAELKQIIAPFLCFVYASSQALCREYLDTFGHILHHNIDKGLPIAGRTEPRPGGGRVLEPMRLVFGDRAAGKNPVSHVGKIYTLLTHRMAPRFMQVCPDCAKFMSRCASASQLEKCRCWFTESAWRCRPRE